MYPNPDPDPNANVRRIYVLSGWLLSVWGWRYFKHQLGSGLGLGFIWMTIVSVGLEVLQKRYFKHVTSNTLLQTSNMFGDSCPANPNPKRYPKLRYWIAIFDQCPATIAPTFNINPDWRYWNAFFDQCPGCCVNDSALLAFYGRLWQGLDLEAYMWLKPVRC